MRTKNILGFDKMMETIQNWKPDYNKVVRAIKYACIKAILKQIKPPDFLKYYGFVFFNVA